MWGATPMLAIPVAAVRRRSWRRHAEIAASEPRSLSCCREHRASRRLLNLLNPDTGVLPLVEKMYAQPSIRGVFVNVSRASPDSGTT